MADVHDEGTPTARPWSGGGREELAAALRRLTALTVTAMAPGPALHAAAVQVGAIADELEAHVPEPGPAPVSRFADRSSPPSGASGLAAAMPFDMVIGSCNPVAPPITIEFDPPKAIGTVTFSPTYEGAPGCVHGAVLAGAFDMMLTAANVIAEAAGPTVSLTIRYRKPTIVGEPCRFEAWVTSANGRRTRSLGRLLQGDVVTVEAEGEFVNMARSDIRRMHRREGRPRRPKGAEEDSP
jgi:acyl-coenzyme A thioesterase PaaI-like protein